MKKQCKTSTLTILFACILLISSSPSYSKLEPSNFTDLVKISDLIVIVNVYEIKSQGKLSPGLASAKISKIIVGKSEIESIKIRWSGIAITELGEWVMFLSSEQNRDNGNYKPAYGSRSFWKIEYAHTKNSECCSQFVVLRQPMNLLKITSSLFSEQFVYFNSLPNDKNPIKNRGILIEELISHIKKERHHENESR